MMGIRLEMRGLIYTGPSTILHNLRKTVERAGISVENISSHRLLWQNQS